MGGPPPSPSTATTEKPPTSPTMKKPPVSPASSGSKPPISPAANRKPSTPVGRKQALPESAASPSAKSVASPSSKSGASVETPPLPARYANGEDFRVKVRLVALSGIMTMPLPPTTPKRTLNQKRKSRRGSATSEDQSPVTASVSFVVNNATVEAKVKGAKKEGQRGRYSVRRMARVPSKPLYQTMVPLSPTSTLGGAIRHVARWGGQYRYPSALSSAPSSPATPKRATPGDEHDLSSGPQFSSPSTVYLSTRLAREEGMSLQLMEPSEKSQQDDGVETAEDRNDDNPSSAQDEVRQQDDLLSEELSPELIRIHVGVSRNEEHIPLGVATLVISGAPLEGQAMDLPVQQLDAGTVVSGEIDEVYSISVPENTSPTVTNTQASGAPKKKRSLFRRILATVKHSDADTQTVAGAFLGDNQRYGIAHNAVLRISVDLQLMKDGEHFRQLPHVPSIDSADFDNSLNGDDDDDVIVDEDDDDEDATFDQERRIMVVTAMPDETALAAGRDLDESIEVMTGDIGVTVISSPLAATVSAQSDVPSIVVTDVPVQQRRRKTTGSSDGGSSSRGKMREVGMGKAHSAPTAGRMLPSTGSDSTSKEAMPKPRSTSSDNGADREKSLAATAGDKTFVADSIFFEVAHASTEEERSAIAKDSDRRKKFVKVESMGDEDENDHEDGDDEDEDEDDEDEDEEDAGYTVEGTVEDYTVGDETLTLNDGHRTERAESNESDSSDASGEASVGQDTIDSLNKAKDTLRRYAHRTGVKVEDLIDGEGVRKVIEEEDDDDDEEEEDDDDEEEDDEYTESYRTYEDGSTTYRSRTFDDGSTLVSQLDTSYEASRQHTYGSSVIARTPRHEKKL